MKWLKMCPLSSLSSPEVDPQQACSDQPQPLTGLPVVGQHDGHHDDLPGVCIVELFLTAAGGLVGWSHERTDHHSLFHTCSHPENTQTHGFCLKRLLFIPSVIMIPLYSRVIYVPCHASFDIHPHRQTIFSEAVVYLFH